MKREVTVAMPTTMARPQCLRPRCTREAVARGLCASDYQIAYQLVSAEVTSWTELEKAGKALEPRPTVKAWFLGQ